jgi:hypothetical protein
MVQGGFTQTSSPKNPPLLPDGRRLPGLAALLHKENCFMFLRISLYVASPG